MNGFAVFSERQAESAFADFSVTVSSNEARHFLI